jgi:hypothetical protein
MAFFIGVNKKVGCYRRGIIVYIEYQNVCPFVGIGSHPPLPHAASDCVSPIGPNGVATLAGGLEWEDPIRTTGQKAWHSVTLACWGGGGWDPIRTTGQKAWHSVTLACWGGVGWDPIRTTVQKAWHSVYSVDDTTATASLSWSWITKENGERLGTCRNCSSHFTPSRLCHLLLLLCGGRQRPHIPQPGDILKGL